nr:alpha/beta hydrolase [Lactobacillus mulieris]
MMKTILKIFYCIVACLTLTACSSTKKAEKSASSVPATNTKQADKRVVTFFFHGWGSSINAEKQMVNAAKQAGVTKDVLTVIVDSNGVAHIQNAISKQAKNPIVKVGYLDNENTNYHTDAKYAYAAIMAVQKQYHYKKMNLVGHSMGNMSIMYLLMDYGKRKSLPKLEKQVDIAGHFNGIIAYDKTSYTTLNHDGKPEQMNNIYKELLKMRSLYPKGVSVLNIYGNLNDGSNSDGIVSNVSSRSLKYLIAPHVKSYTEKEILGKMGQHSKLHENKQVDQVLIKFLWNK